MTLYKSFFYLWNLTQTNVIAWIIKVPHSLVNSRLFIKYKFHVLLDLSTLSLSWARSF